MNTRWRATAIETLLWAVYDDDVVVYHIPSGRTHLMNASSWYLVHDVLAKPKDLRTIISTFSSNTHDDEDEELRDHWLSLIQRLEQLGLVERT